MTRDEVLAMKPGRELDALVAEKVMGWQIFGDEGVHPRHKDLFDKTPHWSMLREYPCYSEKIAAAWEVVGKINDCLHLKEHGVKGVWEVFFCGYHGSIVSADTAPEAICKAALLAVMEVDK